MKRTIMFIATTAATLATLSCEGKATLGDMYLRMGKFQRAAEAYREHLENNPRISAPFATSHRSSATNSAN